jgi:hypothetical protein
MFAVYFIGNRPVKNYRTQKDAVYETIDEAREFCNEMNQSVIGYKNLRRYHVKAVEVKPVRNKKEKVK